jgi:RNA polymerase sigma factor (TIGR02999 family)
VTRSTQGEITQLLTAWGAGERDAEERLFALLYEELRTIAARHRQKERAHHSLRTTALVHEAYMRLVRQHQVSWNSRGHFMAVASRAMRRILVDHARRRKAAKRGGGIPPAPLDSVVLALEDSVDLVELDVALEKLARLDPREAQVVDLRFFAGLTVPEVARALDVSRATVERDWVAARAWLHRELDGGGRADA